MKIDLKTEIYFIICEFKILMKIIIEAIKMLQYDSLC